MMTRTLQTGEGWFPERDGGLNRVYRQLVESLPAAGIEVRGLVTGTADVGPGSAGVVRSFAAPDDSLRGRLRGARTAIRQELEGGATELVASHFALYAFPALDRLARLPFVVHFHGPWAEESRVEGQPRWVVQYKRAIERAVYRRATRLIVLSEAFRDLLHRQYGVDASRIRIVPGGVDTRRFDVAASRAEARARLGWPEGRPVVLAVRRLARRMGLENLIDAVAAVRREVPEVLLLVAGRGALHDELDARIRARGLDEHVRLLGFVPDEVLPLAYRAADLTVVPTVSLEGFGLITVESLAAGTPALVTPVGGLPEIVRGLAPELVLDDRGVDALARGLVQALDGTMRLPDAETCRAYARRHFDWSVVAERTGAVYREALAA